MLIRSYKLQSISWFQLFALFFVSRVLVSLTYIPSLNGQAVNGDFLLSILLMLPLLVLACLPVCFYMRVYRNEPLPAVANRISRPLGVGVSALSFLWFLYAGALNVTRFSYFVTSEMSQDLPSFVLILIVLVSAFYGAYLGLQNLGRLSTVVLWLLLFSFAFVMLFSLQYFHIRYFSPILENSFLADLWQALNLAANTTVLSTLPFLTPPPQQPAKKRHFVIWSCGVSAIVFLLMFVTIGTLGNYAETQNFPVFTMSQISGIGILQRLEMLHTSIWIISLFLKVALFLVAACTALRGVFPGLKLLWALPVSAVLMFGIAYGISFSFPNYQSAAQPWYTLAPFFLFTLVVPGAFALMHWIRQRKGAPRRA